MKRYLSSFLITFFFITLLLVSSAIVVSAAPPEGFTSTLLIGSGLHTPDGMAIASDGRIFIIEKGGAVKIYKNGQLLASPFVQLPVQSDGEQGLLGIALDPNFSTNKFIYFNYTGTDYVNRIIRFSAASDTVSLDMGTVILQIPLTKALIHVGGTIAFGKDGKLYISVGDNSSSGNSQNLNVLMGKILRINADGSIPSDNPFVNQNGKRGEIWAYGLRNPFRFNVDVQTGDIYVGDVGENTWEELNKIEKGKNYGWPEKEGKCVSNCAGFTDPIYTYQHTNGRGGSVTGGPVYRGAMFPASYQGVLFYADYVNLFLQYITFDANGNASGSTMFDPQAGAVVDQKIGPDGSLYYLTIYPGNLYQVTYATDNQVPTAKSAASPLVGTAPLSVQFSSEGSTDPENNELSYEWDFGDGSKSAQANPQKTYETNGTYTVNLTVSDGVHTASANPLTIQVGIAPTISFISPVANTTYTAGQSIFYDIAAKDGAGNTIPDENISLDVIFHHNDHVHPFLTLDGKHAGTFTIPTEGHSAIDTWYELKATGKDSTGVSATQSVFIYPKTMTFTVDSNPSGLVVLVDGAPIVTPKTIEGVVGFHHEISAAPTQDAGGTDFYFDYWSNGGATTQVIDTSVSGKTYMATFTKAQPFRGVYFNNKDLDGKAVLVRNEKNINFDWGYGSPSPEVNAEVFSARWTGKQDFAAGKYRFTMAGDDGIRLYIDNILLIDHWQDQPLTAYSHDIVLSEGVHDIKMEYYENGGGAGAKLQWEYLDSTVAPITYAASYYNNESLSGTPVFSRSELGINNNWRMSSPHVKVNKDGFSGKWVGKHMFEKGYYTFSVTADDGVRLYVDNKLLIDKWKVQGATTYQAETFIDNGEHTITTEYFEDTGEAALKVSFTQRPEFASSWLGEYFDNTSLSYTPVVTRQDPSLQFYWGQGAPTSELPRDNFSARWSRTQYFAAGSYTFSLKSDDGIRFWVDDVLVVDDWTNHPTKTYEPTVAISSGIHTLKIEYYEGSGDAVVAFTQK